MDKRVKRRFQIIAAVLAGGWAAHGASAAVVTYADAALGVDAVPATALGYVFYDAGAGVGSGSGSDMYTGTSAAAPVPYVSVSPSGSEATGNDFGSDTDSRITPYTQQYSILNINGTDEATGVIYQYSGGNTSTLATINLGPGLPVGTPIAPFSIGVLVDNAGYSVNNRNSSIAVGGVSQDVRIVEPDSVNDFYYFNVTGGVAGDALPIQATATAPHSYALIGGFTFGAPVVVTPEPTTIALVGLAGMAAALRRRSGCRRSDAGV